MKLFFDILLSLGLVLGLSLGSNEVVDAKIKVNTYKNCAALNNDHKGGVARSSSVKNKGGKTKYKPYISKGLYDANEDRYRDKDLIAWRDKYWFPCVKLDPLCKDLSEKRGLFLLSQRINSLLLNLLVL